MTKSRFCIFCGEKPENKNKEHILPQWLIELTGDPSRVVDFGINYETGNTIRFSWSNLVAPSCSSCNSAYSDLEGKVKPLMESLIARQELTGADYITLLDWLDKVRIGLWLTYHFIQRNPTDIDPQFHINKRVASKDRMLAIYLMQTNNVGLNAFGAETLVFHRTPSCFALNVNNVAILNMSCDYLFARRCGFPAPKHQYLLLDGDNAGKLQFSGFSTSRHVMHPLITTPIFKPSVHLLQPIMQADTQGVFQGGYLGAENLFDSYLSEMTIFEKPNQGVLFSQKPASVEVLNGLDEVVEFQNVSKIEARTLYEILSQVYDLQNYCHMLVLPTSSDAEKLREHQETNKMLLRQNRCLKSELLQLYGRN